MMRGLLLCCLVALATSQPPSFELGLSQGLVYEYKYEGRVDFGLARINRLESGVRIKCTLKISGVSGQTYALHVSDLSFEEFNGIPEKDKHDVSQKISKRLIDQLSKAIMFDYFGGHVSNIQVPKGVSDTTTNIVKGMLSCFHTTLKTKQRVYGLTEVNIHGNCHTNYVIEGDTKGEMLKLTQEVDINDCSEKAELYSGMATAVLDKVSKQKGDSVVSTMTNTYSINKTDHGGLITNVISRELQYFSSFNVKGGTFRMKAEKKLDLLSRTPKTKSLKMEPMDKKGDIRHKIVEANAYLPIVMQDLNDIYPKALKLIEELADANKYSLNKTTTEKSIKVYQLLRSIKYDDLEKMWKALKDKDEQRRWFLDLVAEINDARIVMFLKDRYKSKDISETEAVQVHMLAISHLNSELVYMAKDFFEESFCQDNKYLWQTVMLTYGSLVYRHCAYNTTCSVSAVEPLHKEANKSRETRDENRMITVLKALGNAGHKMSVKRIMDFLPNVGANTQGFKPSASVMIAAVQSLRLIAARDPDSVQDVAFKVFTQKSLDARVRMHAFLMLLEARPPLSLVIRVSSLLLVEEDDNVGSTAYFYLKRLARSSTPDNHYLSTACSVAVKMLTPKFGRHSNGYHQALRLDWFDDNFLIGTAAEAFMLRSAANAAPSEVRMRTKFFFIGRILELLEVGIQAEEIKELFSSTGKDNDFNALFKKILNWQDVPNDKPVFSVYTRLSGQELFFFDIKKKWIQSIIKYLWPSPGKDSTLEVIGILQENFSLKFAKTFLAAEARYFQATSLGLQAEIAKYYLSTNDLRFKASITSNPPLKDDLGNLLSTDVSLKTEGSLGLIKDIWLYFGINTDLFQVGNELRSKVVLSLPWNIDAPLNFKDSKFGIEFPSLKEDFEVVCISSDVYAINRNIDDPKKESSLIPRFPEPRMMTEASPVLEANYVNLKRSDCAESKTYGIGVCAISDIQRRYYHEEYPLYYLMGFTHMAIKAVTVETEQPIKKIHLEYNSKIKKDPPSTRQLLETLRSFSEATDPVALVDFKVLALNDGPRPEGYQGGLYPNSQLIVSRVGGSISKEICVNYTGSTLYDAKANISFGHECEPYSLSVRAVTTPEPCFLLPASIKTYLNWVMIPESIAELGRRIGSYMPGIAVLSGFSEMPAKNTEKEVTATVTVASADSIGVELKIPKHTMRHRAIPFPMPPGNYSRNMRLDDL